MSVSIKLLRVILVISCIISLRFSAYAAEKPVWVEVEGKAYQGEIDTPKEVSERAKRDAERRALEKAVGIFLKSHTLVSNSQICEDLIYTSVRGEIAQVEVIKSGWDDKDRNLYKVTIKALVKPFCPEKGEGLAVKLFLSKTDLREGDKIKIFYQPNSDCYIYLFSVAADGSVTLLLPCSMIPDNKALAKMVYEFPPDGSSIRLQAMFLPEYKRKTAKERIKLIATKKKERLLPLGFQEGVFKVYDAKSTGMISDLIKRLNQIAPTDWAEATAIYNLRR